MIEISKLKKVDPNAVNLKYFEIEDKEELMILEKQLIFKHKPVLNISHKYKIFNKLY